MGFEAAVWDIWLRLGIFLSVFAVLALVESWRPRRRPSQPRELRWLTNLSIVAIDSLAVRAMAALSVPLAAVAAAMFAGARGFGLLNWLALPHGLEFAIALIVLDLAVWVQHVASHKIPLLWRLHQMHHADRDVDVTTALRFHPIEIALSMIWKVVVVLALGASPLSVVLFEIVLSSCAMFSHANIRLPGRIDAMLRRILVTPEMHRIHHSTLWQERDSNYGFNLSVWDRLFGTYTEQPEKGHENMRIGLDAYQDDGPNRLLWNLILPFKKTRFAGGFDR